MVGQRTVTKPSRSDEVLDADEQLRIADKIRAQFETLAPKRPVKPNRSESDSSTPTPVESTTVDVTIPELDKFRALRSQSHVCNVHQYRFNARLFSLFWLFLVIDLSERFKIGRL